MFHVEHLYIQSASRTRSAPQLQPCLLGNAEVKANGVLDETMPPPARAVPGLIPFTLQGGEAGLEAEQGADFIVYAGGVGAVRDVEAFGDELDVRLLA